MDAHFPDPETLIEYLSSNDVTTCHTGAAFLNRLVQDGLARVFPLLQSQTVRSLEWLLQCPHAATALAAAVCLAYHDESRDLEEGAATRLSSLLQHKEGARVMWCPDEIRSLHDCDFTGTFLLLIQGPREPRLKALAALALNNMANCVCETRSLLTACEAVATIVQAIDPAHPDLNLVETLGVLMLHSHDAKLQFHRANGTELFLQLVNSPNIHQISPVLITLGSSFCDDSPAAELFYAKYGMGIFRQLLSSDHPKLRRDAVVLLNYLLRNVPDAAEECLRSRVIDDVIWMLAPKNKAASCGEKMTSSEGEVPSSKGGVTSSEGGVVSCAEMTTSSEEEVTSSEGGVTSCTEEMTSSEGGVTSCAEKMTPSEGGVASCTKKMTSSGDMMASSAELEEQLTASVTLKTMMTSCEDAARYCQMTAGVPENLAALAATLDSDELCSSHYVGMSDLLKTMKQLMQ